MKKKFIELSRPFLSMAAMVFLFPFTICAQVDTLPDVLPKNHSDLIEARLRYQAFLQFMHHQLPIKNPGELEVHGSALKQQIIKKTGVLTDPKLDFNLTETGSTQMKGYHIKNIAFQTRPGVYATANLYVPEGTGPFPAVILMMGHSKNGRFYENYQSVAHSLALNGYVCLSIDPWGSGERTTTHGVFEYHGANLGGSLLNIGESLIGMQLTDNIRGVDLLSSLPYVDAKNIGATGSSGGGNQTMWLAAMDNRIKAAMPVVSVGTFESYVMRSNCICELLNDGLTFTEAAGVLAMVAPRAIKMCNHTQDSSPAFLPVEMRRSFSNAQPVFRMMGVEDHIANQEFDKTHGYWKEDREAMLGWFDLHLKGIGNGASKKEIPFDLLPQEKLMTYAAGKRDKNVVSTAGFCIQRGNELRKAYIETKRFDADKKREELKAILRIQELPVIKEVHHYSSVAMWERFTLKTSDGKLIPLLCLKPANRSSKYVIVCNSGGKKNIPAKVIDELRQKGVGIAVVELSGTGELLSSRELKDKTMVLHTISRSELWLGRTVLGEWVEELSIVSGYLKTRLKATEVAIDGSREAAIAAMFVSALGGDVNNLVLRDMPVSYLFDNRDSIDFFNMAVHLPGFLKWGDLSLAAALNGKNMRMINPVTMSGRKLTEDQLKAYRLEFAKFKKMLNQTGSVTLLNL
ncbi:hypothetical protein ABIE26_001525 [Pedobacter africanus]|uniref:Uncharacterized protein n=1 Tax=Pedobacter africanus TaxID=151894 RepID=A0ACC6KRZ4_9SPHI|nr:acetylxylan esterase [Pedobacter africanus]MDR6781986.1 hypothetical protein [Pedobacter africanus]